MRIIVLGLVLLAQALAYKFPYGRCYERNCGTSPYQLVWSAANGSHLCFRLDAKNRTAALKDPYGCYNRFQKDVPKIVLETKPRCKTAIQSVAVDDRVKKGGVYFTTYDTYKSELVITSLSNINASTVFCLKVTAPCKTVSKICRKGSCKYALYEPAQHDCCPTCAMQKDTIANAIANAPPPL